MKKLLTGNEAVAQGAWEAGLCYAAAYPGTPSTEILENLAQRPELVAEWAVNEKVALEAAIGASIAGARSLAAMKHVGLNVAADPLFTFAYTGVGGGAVIINADEPGQFSSQNEQDNRWYAKSAKLPLLEPSDSGECLAMTKEAFAISERFDTPVLIRLTTRVCHSKSVVETGEREARPLKAYQRQADKYVMVPANSRKRRILLEERLTALAEFSEATPLNFIEGQGAETGVVVSGGCYHYAREVFGESVDYLKLGFTHPLPEKLISGFCDQHAKIYVIEENDPYLEEAVQRLGFQPLGKSVFPKYGEMTPEVLRQAVLGQRLPQPDYDAASLVNRPPTLCAGCPHRGFFYELGRRAQVIKCGDIGCYTLGFAPPFHALDATICMGASISAAHGAAQALRAGGDRRPVVAVIGDSTFFHTGINSLMNTIYNNSPTVNVILDNRITGMTGHQENPGSGYNAAGQAAPLLDIEALVRAMGCPHIRTVNPNDLPAVRAALDELLALDAPAVLITRWPCALKRFSPADQAEFPAAFSKKFRVSPEACIGCKRCLQAGCPALSFQDGQAAINRLACLGCGVCSQLCPKQAIQKEEA